MDMSRGGTASGILVEGGAARKEKDQEKMDVWMQREVGWSEMEEDDNPW